MTVQRYVPTAKYPACRAKRLFLDHIWPVIRTVLFILIMAGICLLVLIAVEIASNAEGGVDITAVQFVMIRLHEGGLDEAMTAVEPVERADPFWKTGMEIGYVESKGSFLLGRDAKGQLRLRAVVAPASYLAELKSAAKDGAKKKQADDILLRQSESVARSFASEIFVERGGYGVYKYPISPSEWEIVKAGAEEVWISYSMRDPSGKVSVQAKVAAIERNGWKARVVDAFVSDLR